MLISFLLGGILGIIGLVSTDGYGFLLYLVSEQNLKFDKVLFTSDNASYLNTCFNGKFKKYN